MARLRDMPRVFRTVGYLEFFRRVWAEVSDDHVLTWASALAYSWLFAIFPFAIFLLAMVPFLPDNYKDGLEVRVEQSIRQVLAKDAYETVWGFVEPRLQQMLTQKRTAGGVMSVGLLLAIWGASGGMAMTISALDRCYDSAEPRKFIRLRLMSILLTLIFASLILLVIVLIPVSGIALRWLAKHDPSGLFNKGTYAMLNACRYALALICMFAALAVLYNFGPNVRQRWRWITPGSLFCVVVWIALGFAFRGYINTFGKYQQTYGAVGGVVILLLFFYIDALVLLIGAEINSEVDYVTLGVQPGSRDFTGKPWEHLETSKDRGLRTED